MLGFVKIEFFDKNQTFRIVCKGLENTRLKPDAQFQIFAPRLSCLEMKIFSVQRNLKLSSSKRTLVTTNLFQFEEWQSRAAANAAIFFRYYCRLYSYSLRSSIIWNEILGVRASFRVVTVGHYRVFRFMGTFAH